MQIRTILYQYIKTLIKHVFLLNFTYECTLEWYINGHQTLNGSHMSQILGNSFCQSSFYGKKIHKDFKAQECSLITQSCELDF